MKKLKLLFVTALTLTGLTLFGNAHAAEIVVTSPPTFEAFVGETPTRDITVTGSGTSGTFTYQTGGDDAVAFEVTNAADAADATDGTANTVTIKFTPTEARAYNATLTVSGGGEDVEPVTILLKGNALALPVQLSPSESPSANDKWYYIFNNRRMVTGQVFEDKDGTIKQTAVIEPLSDNQLWKIVKVADGKYQFINKGTGAKIGHNSDNTNIPTSTAATSTFKFVPGTGDNAGFWVIYCNEKSMSINKAGSGDTYGYYGNPQAGDAGNCVRFVQKAIAVTSPAAFANAFVGETSTQAITITGIATGGTFAYQIDGADADAFEVTGTNNDATSGVSNAVTIKFTPTAVKTYNATLTISGGGEGVEPETISLSGTALAFPVQLSTEGNENWYYIFNNRRMPAGQVFEDKDATIKQTKVTQTSSDNQLWKIIKMEDGKYQLINKGTNNKIGHNSGDNIPTSATATTTFKFLLGTDDNTGFWVISCNDKGKSINKAGSGDAYAYWGTPNANDAGNCVRFVKEEDVKSVFYPDQPLLSTDEDEHWYQIQFFRQPSKAVEYVSGQVLKQLPAAAKTAQYWKITGSTHEDCKIENYSGLKIGSDGGNRYKPTEDGDSFQFEKDENANSLHWQLKNNTAVVNGYRYVNDESGNEVTGYSKNDNGAFLLFIPVNPAPEFLAGSELLDFEVAPTNDKVEKTLSVAGRSLSGTITYALGGDDADAFEVSPAEGWSAKRGGDLIVGFTPTTVKTYQATLTIQTEGPADIVVNLTGTGSSDPILYVTPLSLPFGDVTTGLDSETKEITISVAYPTGDITYTKTGTDAAAFEITESPWTAAEGGTLKVVFKPTAEKEYSASIEITSPDAESKTITLTGKGVITELPVTLSTDDAAVWYYIEANKRTGQYYQDLGADKALEVRPAFENEDGQLWKIVSTGISGKYLLISKTGNQIAYTAAATGDIAADRFYTTASPVNTYSFAKREDGSWQIRCNEENSFINKAQPTPQLTNTQFGKYAIIPDDGSSVAFIPEADIVFHVPVFSTEAESTWYYVRFLKEKTANSNLYVQGNGENGVVTQAIYAETNVNQFWKFTGTWDDCKIVNTAGLELKLVDASYQLVAAGSGDAHRLFWHNAANETGWRLVNKSVTGNNPVVNDYEHIELHMWNQDGNPGNAFEFIPVPVPFDLDFVIEATAEASANAYNTLVYGNIIFKSTDDATGQLKDIPEAGLQVNGVVKVEKQFAFGKEYSIGFPFAVASVSDETYSLKSYNGTINLFESASAFVSGAGYLIQFPAPAETEATYVSVTFTSAATPALYNATNLSAPDGYHLVANPLVIVPAAPVGGAEAFYPYGFEAQAFALAEDVFSLKPFEALVTVKGVSTPLYAHIGDGIIDGLENIDANDPVVDVKYYTLQGFEVQQLRENGVYIIKKIHASQKTEVVKVFFKK